MDVTNWAIMRQLVVAATDATGQAAAVARELGLPDGFADPVLHEIGLADASMPVGPQKFFEVVGPLNPDNYLNRFLDRVGGQGGYCLAVQVPDVYACRDRALARGIRLAAEADPLGHHIVQLRPADLGVLLELDGIADPDQWFWDDITPGPAPDALVDDILSVQIGAVDPAASCELWAHILGLPPVTPTSLDLSGCRIDFVVHEVGQVLSAEFRLSPGATAPETDRLVGLGVSYTAAVMS